MFFAEDDLTLHITRGDTGDLVVRAIDETADGGETPYIFKAGDVLRLKVYEKKNCENVILQKDFGVEEDTETAILILSETDTRIGNTINKPVDYWYEIELNPFTEPQTIVGYDDDGAKIFKLYPEGKDTEVIPPTPEEVGVLDSELSLTSQNAIQNQAVSRAIANLTSTVNANDKAATEGIASANSKINSNFDLTNEKIDSTFELANEKIVSTNNRIETTNKDVAVLTSRLNNLSSLPEGSTSGDAELQDIRVGYNGKTYETAGEAVRCQIGDIDNIINKKESLIIGQLADKTNYYPNWVSITYSFTAKQDFTLNSIELPLVVKVIDVFSSPELSGNVIPDGDKFLVLIDISKKNSDDETYTTVYSGILSYNNELSIGTENQCVLSSLLNGGIKLEKDAEYNFYIHTRTQELTRPPKSYHLQLLFNNSTDDEYLYNDDFISFSEKSTYEVFQGKYPNTSTSNRFAATFNISTGQPKYILTDSDKQDIADLVNIPANIRTVFNPNEVETFAVNGTVNISTFAKEPQGYDVTESFILVNDTYDEATGSGACIEIQKGSLIVVETKYDSRGKKWNVVSLTVNTSRGDYVLLSDTINSDNWDSEYTPIMSEVLAELDNRIGTVETNLTSVIDDLEGVL